MHAAPIVSYPRFVPTALLLACALLGACSTAGDAARRALDAVTPYRVEVVQGNFVSREQVQMLRLGMGHQQVRDILGTPLLESIFHADRWDYVFTIARQGVAHQEFRVTVFFQDGVLSRLDGDELPSETEFVASIVRPVRSGKVPQLEATPEQLERFAATSATAPSSDSVVAPDGAAAAAARSYPPLD